MTTSDPPESSRPAPEAAGPSSGPLGPGRLIHQRLAHLIALGFGSGLWPIGPGTAGTLWAWAAFLVIDFLVPSDAWLVILAVGWPLGVWACEQTGRALGQPDHSSIVWDEIWAFWLVLSLLPRANDPYFSITSLGLAVWQLQLLAFCLFRLFDITKPPPIGWVDRRVKGGWGVMLDDLLAAGYTVLILAILVRLAPTLTGWLGASVGLGAPA